MIRAAFFSLLLLAAAPVAASNWAVLPAQSSILFTPVWNGEAVEGRFPKFTADIRLDPARLADARVDVVMDLSAATTGNRTVNGSLPGPDWFDVKSNPVARFQSSSISLIKPGRYLAKGMLGLRGVSMPVSLPFTLAIRGNTAVMTGQTVLDRRHFRIGMESDSQGAWVAFPVPIRIHLTATRKP
jgi:cytochrome b561